jgi:hypothetical protein
MAGARARLQWIAEGAMGAEEFEVLLDLIQDLEAWQARHGPELSKFEFRRRDDVL